LSPLRHLPTVRAACHTSLRVPLAVQSAASQLIHPVRVSLRCQCPAGLNLGPLSETRVRRHVAHPYPSLPWPHPQQHNETGRFARSTGSRLCVRIPSVFLQEKGTQLAAPSYRLCICRYICVRHRRLPPWQRSKRIADGLPGNVVALRLAHRRCTRRGVWQSGRVAE
jgi:hypothetical protein